MIKKLSSILNNLEPKRLESFDRCQISVSDFLNDKYICRLLFRVVYHSNLSDSKIFDRSRFTQKSSIFSAELNFGALLSASEVLHDCTTLAPARVSDYIEKVFF